MNENKNPIREKSNIRGEKLPANKRKIDTIDGDKTEKKDVETKNSYKYIGETSRSGYERSREHWEDFENLNPRSHILKHYLDKHQDIPMNKLK